MKRIIFLIILVFTALVSPAFAEDVVNPIGSAVAEFLTTVIFPILGAMVAALVAVILDKLRTKFNIQISNESQAKLEQLARQAVGYVEEKAAARVKARLTGWTRSEKLDLAIAHIISAAPKVTPEQADILVHSVLGRVDGAGATDERAVR